MVEECGRAQMLNTQQYKAEQENSAIEKGARHRPRSVRWTVCHDHHGAHKHEGFGHGYFKAKSGSQLQPDQQAPRVWRAVGNSSVVTSAPLVGFWAPQIQEDPRVFGRISQYVDLLLSLPV